MKKLTLIFAVALVSGASVFANGPQDYNFKSPLAPHVYGKRRSDVSNVIKFNPLALVFSRYSLAYERVLNENMSLVMEGAYVNQNINLGITEFGITGFRVSPQFRYYITSSRKGAPRGFYAAPYVEYSNYKMSITQQFDPLGTGDEGVEASISFSLFGGGACLGYQWLVGDVVAIDLYAGAGLALGGVKGSLNIGDESSSTPVATPSVAGAGFSPNFGFSVGFGF
jgi:hypothetical protein